MTPMVVVTALFLAAGGLMALLFPELRYKSKDAIWAGVLLFAGYALAMAKAGGLINRTIDQMVTLLVHSVLKLFGISA